MPRVLRRLIVGHETHDSTLQNQQAGPSVEAVPEQRGDDSMGVTTSLTSSSPLSLPERRTLLRAPDLESQVKEDRTGHVLNRVYWEAALAGDQKLLRDVSGFYLSSASKATVGIGRERLIASAAWAHADSFEVRSLKDLRLKVPEARNCVGFVQMATGDFGARCEGALDRHADRARDRLSKLGNYLDDLVVPRLAQPWHVIRSMSFLGDFHVRDAIVRLLHEGGDGGWGTVTDAAYDRRLHLHPESAVEKEMSAIIRDELNEDTMAASLNVLAASLGDLCRFNAAAEMALLSLAFRPDDFAGRAGGRALNNIGRIDLKTRSWSIANEWKRYESHWRDMSSKAIDILRLAGRPDLVQLHSSGTRVPSEWAPRVLQIISDDHVLLDQRTETIR